MAEKELSQYPAIGQIGSSTRLAVIEAGRNAQAPASVLGAFVDGQLDASGIPAEVEALKAGQQTSAIYADTLADLQARTGTYEGQGAFVNNGEGAGQYIWDGAAWQFSRPDVVSQKLDKAVFEAVIRPAVGGPALVRITDQNGYSTWLEANAQDGGLTEQSVSHLRRAVPGLPLVQTVAGVLIGLCDAEGRSTWLQASTDDGGLTPFATKCIRKALESDAEILTYVCEGDSMTASNYGGGTTYPAKLALLLGKPVINVGISGTNALEISIRAGGVVPLVTLPTGVLPADTNPIPVTWDVTGPSGSGQPSRNYDGTIRGVPVRLTWSSASATLTLTRRTPGQAMPMSSPVVFDMETPYLVGPVHIVWSGRNDYPKQGAFSSIEEQLSRLESVSARYLVLSVCNTTGEPSGTAGYMEVVELNSRIQKRAPRQYVDMRGRLIREGLALSGLEPTAADLAAIEQDRIPPSLLADGLHPNDSGRVAIAAIVYNELQIRGLAQ